MLRAHPDLPGLETFQVFETWKVFALRTLGNGEQDDILFCSIHDNIAQEREREGGYQAALRNTCK